MFFLVYFPDLHEKRIVKSAWIKTIPVDNMCKRGINRNIWHLIFFSEDENEKENFKLPISRGPNNGNACYIGLLIKCFGKNSVQIKKNIFIINNWLIDSFAAKLEEAKKYERNHRTFCPAIYNEKRLKEYRSDVSFEEMEIENVVDETAAQLEELSQVVKQLNEQLGVEDLTADDDDDDGDFHGDEFDDENDAPFNDLISGHHVFEITVSMNLLKQKNVF